MAGEHSPNAFGAWLRGRRREAGVTQDALAERLSCSLITLQKIESGERRPSRQMALLLAEQLNVPPDEWEAFVTFARTSRASATLDVDGEARQAPWRTVYRAHTNLPVALTALVGREHDEDSIRDLIMQTRVRLVTLVGPPGVGKTRLGLQVVSELGDSFEDGVFFVDLSPVTDPGMVASTTARALGLREVPNQPPEVTLEAHLRDKKLLLLLDNFEQVLDAAPMLATLLQACPWLKVLVTSREALHLRGERRYNVPPLELPDPTAYAEIASPHALNLAALARNPSVELFVERAQDVQPGFELEEANARDVAAVCAGLDGLPLAIELAAARADVIPLADMRAGLDRRLHLLTKGARDLPPRQRTLRNAIEWSYSLLPEGDRRTLEDAAVLLGGFTLSGAEAVRQPGDGPTTIREHLASLVSKSLLQRQGADVGGEEERFSFLETLREYALERLEEGEAEPARLRHAEYFMRLAEELAPRLTSNEQAALMSKLLREHDNIRAALAWALQPNEQPLRQTQAESYHYKVEIGLRLAGSLRVFWLVQGFVSEGRAWLRRTLAAAGVNMDGVDEASAGSRWRAYAQDGSRDLSHIQKVIFGVGMLEHVAGNYTEALRFFTPALEIARMLGDEIMVARALGALSKTAGAAKEFADARRLGEQTLDLARRLAAPPLIAMALTDLSDIAIAIGDLSRARELQSELLEVTRQSGNLELIGRATFTLGQTALAQGDYMGARAAMDETLAIARKLGHREGEALALRDIGAAACGLGEYSKALASLRESLSHLKRLEQHHHLIETLAWIARVYKDQGNLPDAAKLFGAVERVAKERNIPFGSDTALPDPSELARLSESDEVWATAMSEGAAMSLEEVMALALGD